MAISLDSTSSGRNSTGSPLTISHTVGSGSERALYVMTSVQDSNHANFPVTGITFNGVALTKVRSDEAVGNNRTEIWRLIAPDVGTHDIVISVTGSLGELAATCISLFGVDQTTPTDANNGGSGSTSTPTVSLTSITDNAWFLSICSAEDVFTGNGSGQNTIATLTDQSYENARGSYEGPKTPAGAETQSFTINSAQSWAMSSVAIRPSTTSPSASLSPSSSISSSASPSLSPSSSASSSVSPSASSSASLSPSSSASASLSPSSSASPSASFSPSASISPSSSASPSLSPSASLSPSSSISASPSPSVEYVPVQVVQDQFKQPRFTFTVERYDGTVLYQTENWNFRSISREINGSMMAEISTDQIASDIANGITDLFNCINITVSTGLTGPQGIVYFSGYILRRTISMQAGNNIVSLIVTGHASRLFEMLYILESSSKSVFDYSAGAATSAIVTDIIDKARLLDTNLRVNYATGSIEATGDTVKDIFELANLGDALNRCVYLAYTASRIYFWRVLGDNIFTFKKSSTSADHMFTYGLDVLEIAEITEDLSQGKNDIFVAYNNNGGLKRVTNSSNISSYGDRAIVMREGNVPDATTATAIANAYLQSYLPPLIIIRVAVTNKYRNGIESINPGDTCEIINLPDDIQNLLTSNMFITKTVYYKDRVELELSIKNPQIADSIQKIRDEFEQNQLEGIPTTYA